MNLKTSRNELKSGAYYSGWDESVFKVSPHLSYLRRVGLLITELVSEDKE